MIFNIDGREYEDYQLSNSQIMGLLDSFSLTDNERNHLMKMVYGRFKYDLCPRFDEDDDNVFARFFGNFVNGKCNNKKKVANLMCNEHRYLQNEMFLLCLEYIKKLAENCDIDFYDGRNKYAAETSKKIIDHLKEIDYPY